MDLNQEHLLTMVQFRVGECFDLKAWLTGTPFIHISRSSAGPQPRTRILTEPEACTCEVPIKYGILWQTAEGNAYRREIFSVNSIATGSLSE